MSGAFNIRHREGHLLCTCKPESCGFVKNPDTEECLEEVVEDDDPLAIEGISVLHEPGPADPDDVVVEGTQARGGPH